MKKTQLYCLLVFSLIWVSCKKEADPPARQETLPSPTHKGANVVAWYTDNITYVAKADETSGVVELDTSNQYNLLNTGSFSIQTSYIDNGGYKRALLLNSPANKNIHFPINSGTAFNIAAYSDNALFEQVIPGDNELTLPTSGGQIVITYYDFSKNILSGTFEFVTVPEAPTPSRKVSGWFDLTFTLQEHD